MNPLVKDVVHFNLPNLRSRLRIDYDPKCLFKEDNRNFDLLRNLVRKTMHERNVTTATAESGATEDETVVVVPTAHAVSDKINALASLYADKYLKSRVTLTAKEKKHEAKAAWARTFALLERTPMEAWIRKYVLALLV